MKRSCMLISCLLLLCGCSLPRYIAKEQKEEPNIYKKYELNDETFKSVKYEDSFKWNSRLCFKFETKGYDGLAYFDAKVNININVKILTSIGNYEAMDYKYAISISNTGKCSEVVTFNDITSYADFKVYYYYEGYALVKGEY